MSNSLLKCNDIFDYFLGVEMKSAYFSTLNGSDRGPTKRNQSKEISTTFIYCLFPVFQTFFFIKRIMQKDVYKIT